MIETDDLALLMASFEAALLVAPGAGEADAAIHELGWPDLLDASPHIGAAAAFRALGTSGAGACLLDDVLIHALGLPVHQRTCVVLPAPGCSSTPATRVGEVVRIDGLVSARAARADRIVVAVGAVDTGAPMFVSVAPTKLRGDLTATLDPDRPFRRVNAVDVAAADVSAIEVTGSWDAAVDRARLALANQLIAASRLMLEQACQHALDRAQFGRSIASFQAVRHRLANTLVAIEAAAAVADAALDTAEDGCVEPLLAAGAKALAGRAARMTATNAQQVLAGIGFTTDHPFHLSLKRTMVVDTLFGSAHTLPAEIGRSLLELRAVPRLIEL